MRTPNTVAIRQLVPKSYHFDGYNELNCQNSRDRPFFTDNAIQMGNYTLTTRLKGENLLEVLFSSVCPKGKIVFQPFELTLELYIQKLKEAICDKRDFIYLGISPTYGEDFSCQLYQYRTSNCQFRGNDCLNLRAKPQNIFAAISFNMEEVQKALSIYHGITNNNDMEENNMKNTKKLLGMNFEFGISKDTNIASTLMGVAVRNRNTGDWITYDSVNHRRTNLTTMKMGDFPIFLLPVQVLNVGDLVKLDGKYYYVMEVRPDNNKEVKLMAPEDGTIQTHLLSDLLIPGLNFYTKVVALDLSSMTDVSSNQNVSNNMLAAICMMQWSKGNKADTFASLDDIDDDAFNGLGQYLPLLMASQAGTNGLPSVFAGADGKPNLLALMALGGDEDSDMTQLMVLSQLMGGGMAGMLPGTTATATSNSAEVVCTECGKVYPEGTNFCPECGGKTVAKKPESEEEVICPNCGKTYPVGTNFCPKCGTATVKKMATCPHCGAELMEGAEFCHKCGKKVTPSTCTKCGHILTGKETFCPKCGTPTSTAIDETPTVRKKTGTGTKGGSRRKKPSAGEAAPKAVTKPDGEESPENEG